MFELTGNSRLLVRNFENPLRYMIKSSITTIRMFKLIKQLYFLQTNTERWATNQTPVLNQTMFYSYYSTLTSDQLDDLLNLYQDDCLLFQYPCQKHVDNIRKFKSLNPDFKHEYRNTWSGRVGDWDTIS